MTSSENYTHLLGIICSVFEAYSAVFFMPEAQGNGVHIVASFSLGEMINQESRFEAGQGLVGWMLSNKQPLLVNNFDQYQTRLDYYLNNDDARVKAFMGCPVRGGGVLCIDSTRQYSFSAKDQKILHLFTELLANIYHESAKDSLDTAIGQYFHSLSLIHELRFRYTRWPLYLNHYLRIMSSATGFDNCIFVSADPSNECYTVEDESSPLMLGQQKTMSRFDMTAGLVGWVFHNDVPVFADGLDGGPMAALFGKNGQLPEFPAVICMPVIVQRSTRGVLCFTSKEARAIPDSMRDFVRMGVDVLALYLEGLFLYDRLRHSVARNR